MLVYSLSSKSADGAESSLTQFIRSFDYLQDEWEKRNNIRTAMFEQAAHDRHLFNYAGKNPHIALKYPE
jgi:hypothetical protein